MAVSAVVQRVFNTILDQLSEEVGALLGAPIEFVDHHLIILSKDKLLEINRGRSVISTMVVSGDSDGEAHIITDLKDSVILGGTLIMLPQEQIEENCKQRSFTGEAADAFGEVANIIAGIYTTVFLEVHPQNFHFKRTSVEDFIPAQIDPQGDTPFPPGEYIYSCCDIKLEGFELHKLEVIVPAQLLNEGTTATAETDSDKADEQAVEPDNIEKQNTEENSPEQDPAPVESEPAVPEEKLVEKETVDRVLRAAIQQCAEEVGAMLGIEMEVEGVSTRYTSKKEFFAKPGKKTIATEMVVSGDANGTAYFLTDLKDAIYLAGTMIMLPADEMEQHIRAGDFGEDEADAFSEIINIVSGGLVQNFEEMYPRKFHLKKGEQELFTPTKVIVEESTPFPPGEYYIVSGTLTCQDRDLNEIAFICPVDLLHMVPRPAENGWGAPAAEKDNTPESIVTQKAASEEIVEETPSPDETPVAEKPTVIVIVCDDGPLSTNFIDSLTKTKQETILFGSGDSFNGLRTKTVLGAFFVMTAVNEQSFATMIKIRAELPKSSPLIVAGPQWTRSDVLKAVRYGANDIILTPASTEEICEKTKTNLKITCL
ncbi:MAG: hypothetical protein B6I36_05165 [Desulfobacteraceae bacterium 4572_35.1]|nr:MAG: hypothetical protein B6I36_05165 [Desulfobacteraceae bacterium 4572_35.1]